MCEICDTEPTAQELSEWGLQVFSPWSTAFKNSLPDSSFAYIEPGGAKDSEGKTKPRSLRHLVYKDASGKPDLSHVRNALARLNQVQNMPAAAKSRVKAMLQRILGRQDNLEDIQSIVQSLAAPDENGLVWVHAFNYRKYNHPEYGEIDFTENVANEMAQNFTNNVLERDVSWNYDHGKDASKGNRAAATVKEVDVREDGLWVGLQPTPTALKEIQDGEWRYVSVERLPEWTHSTTGDVFTNVLWGGAFTNTPFAKGIAPINLSDFDLYERVLNRPAPEPPKEEGGDVVDRKALCQSLGLPEDSDDDAINSRIQALSEAAERGKTPEPKVQRLSESEPELYAEILANREYRQSREAQEFAEGIRSPDGKVLSAVHRDAVRDAKIKLEKGEITVGEFAQIMSEASSKGFVHMDEVGSTLNGHDDDKDTADKLKLSQKFADGAQVLANKEKIPYEQALVQYAAEHPEEAQAYQELRIPVVHSGGGDE